MTKELVQKVVEEGSLDNPGISQFDFYMNFCHPVLPEERLDGELMEVTSHTSSYPWIPKRFIVSEQTMSSYYIVKFSAGDLDDKPVRRASDLTGHPGSMDFEIKNPRLHSVMDPVRIVLRLRPGRMPGRLVSLICADYPDNSEEHARSVLRRAIRRSQL